MTIAFDLIRAATEPQPAQPSFIDAWSALVRMLPSYSARKSAKYPVYIDVRTPELPCWAERVVVSGHGCHAFLALPQEVQDYCYREHNQLPTRKPRTGLSAQLTFYLMARPGSSEAYRGVRATHIVHYDPTSYRGPREFLVDVIQDFNRFQAEVTGVTAAVEPGYVALPPVQRLYLAAVRILQDKLDEAGGSWIRGIGVGDRKVDVGIVESLHTVYNPRNLISPILDVVYSGITGPGEWNKRRVQVGYNTKRNQVLIGIAGGGGKDSIVVPPGRNPREMLRNILETYVRNVREY